ncbi:MAG: tripartite tricarboxylate transporter substrate binding protein [Sphaerochaetaceae bacterium]
MKKSSIAIMLLLFISAFAFAQGTTEADATEPVYPSSDIQFVVPFPVGGSTGTIAQSLVKYLDAAYAEQNVVLSSITGSGGAVGAREILKAKPDGYSFLVAVPGFSVQNVLTGLDFSFRDFENVAAFASSEQVLVVRKDSKYQTFQDLIDEAKANPGTVKFGAPMGTSLFMGVLAMQNELGVQFKIVDIGGVSVKAPELLSGRVDAYLDSSAKTIPYINSDDFRAIGIWSDERSKFLPEVPILKEYGFNAMLEELIGIWAPKGTPQVALDSIEATIKEICEDPAFQAEFDKITTKVTFKDSEAYMKFLEEYEQTVRNAAAFL